MYLASIRLVNWRSYEEASFNFAQPTRRSPLVLIGAMNGSGKTSFLFSLYLGLFGRYGLRYVENFGSEGETELSYYGAAMRELRRQNADPDAPTVVRIEFRSTSSDVTSRSVVVERRWHFNSRGELLGSDEAEEVSAFLDGTQVEVLEYGNLEHARQWICRELFRPHLLPAFFFDGEQAQKLIASTGEGGVRKAVGVLFGTDSLRDLRHDLGSYSQKLRRTMGGAGESDERRHRLERKRQQRDEAEQALEADRRAADELAGRRERIRSRIDELVETLREASQLNEEFETARAARESAQGRLERAREMACGSARRLGLGLALAKRGGKIATQLEAEAKREEWLALRDATDGRREAILDIAMPEPDDLLAALSAETRAKLRERFRTAINEINKPPPEGCAANFRFPFVSGERRRALASRVRDVITGGRERLQEDARELRAAVDADRDARSALAVREPAPEAAAELTAELHRLQAEADEVAAKLDELDRSRIVGEAALRDLNAEVERTAGELEKLRPDERRLDVAERLRRALQQINDRLEPMVLEDLREEVTDRFRRIADRRYRRATVVFDESRRPRLELANGQSRPIDGMSGFERRSFGIAFSLALAEVAGVRLPLVIDTPLGNADSKYRRRLLEALVDCELDQVIVLTHDAEMPPGLAAEFADRTGQRFLIEYNDAKKRSEVHCDRFLHEPLHRATSDSRTDRSREALAEASA